MYSIVYLCFYLQVWS